MCCKSANAQTWSFKLLYVGIQEVRSSLHGKSGWRAWLWFGSPRQWGFGLQSPCSRSRSWSQTPHHLWETGCPRSAGCLLCTISPPGRQQKTHAGKLRNAKSCAKQFLLIVHSLRYLSNIFLALKYLLQSALYVVKYTFCFILKGLSFLVWYFLHSLSAPTFIESWCISAVSCSTEHILYLRVLWSPVFYLFVCCVWLVLFFLAGLVACILKQLCWPVACFWIKDSCALDIVPLSCFLYCSCVHFYQSFMLIKFFTNLIPSLFVCLVGDVFNSGMAESFSVCTLLDMK